MDTLMLTFLTDLVYLATSVAIALWVGWTLHRNGRVFLIEVYQGNKDLADSVNHLLIVGAYLISIGFITFALQYGAAPDNTVGAIQTVSTKVGLVLFVLGGGHFFNILLLSRLRWRVRLVAPQDPTGAGGPGPTYGVERRVAPAEPQEPSLRADGPGVDLKRPARVGQSANPRTGEPSKPVVEPIDRSDPPAARGATHVGRGRSDPKPATGEGGHAAAKGDGPIAMADVTAAAAEVTVVATEWAFTPQVVTVKRGEPVTLVLVNEGRIAHDLDVAALGLHLHAPSGATTRKGFVPDRVGTFELGCDLPGHREWGMVGSLVVTE